MTRAAATFVRWRMPLLNPPTRRSATSSSPTVSRRAVDGGRVVHAVQSGDVADELAGGEHRRAPPRPRAPAPGTAGPRGPSGGCARATRTVPVFGPSSPVIARMSVVLPAPFGPSRPVTPGPNEQLSSDSATFGPNHTETSSTSTVGVGDEGGIVQGARAVSLTRRAPGSGRNRMHEGRDQHDEVDQRWPAGRRRTTPPSGLSASMWPRKIEVAQVEGEGEQVEDRDRPVLVGVAAQHRAGEHRRHEGEREDARRRPTMRRLVSEATATPIAA